MMYLVYLLFGMIAICSLLFAAELIVRAWERADRRSRSARPIICTPTARNVTPIYLHGGLPDRDKIRNIYSLSDQFADRFREVVNS